MQLVRFLAAAVSMLLLTARLLTRQQQAHIGWKPHRWRTKSLPTTNSTNENLSVRCLTATEPVHVCATNSFRFSWLAVPRFSGGGKTCGAREVHLGNRIKFVTFITGQQKKLFANELKLSLSLQSSRKFILALKNAFISP